MCFMRQKKNYCNTHTHTVHFCGCNHRHFDGNKIFCFRICVFCMSDLLVSTNITPFWLRCLYREGWLLSLWCLMTNSWFCGRFAWIVLFIIACLFLCFFPSSLAPIYDSTSFVCCVYWANSPCQMTTYQSDVSLSMTPYWIFRRKLARNSKYSDFHINSVNDSCFIWICFGQRSFLELFDLSGTMDLTIMGVSLTYFI